MNFIGIVLLALALAIDAFFASFSYGLVTTQRRWANSIRLGLTTGFFQFLMPLIGFVFVSGLSRHSETFRGIIESWDHWIAFICFFLLGGNIIWESLRPDNPIDLPGQASHRESCHLIPWGTLLTVGIATSIDALIAGGSIFIINHRELSLGSDVPPFIASLIPATIIGLITSACTIAAFHLAQILQHLPTRLLGSLSGLILIGIGANILIEHLNH